MGTTPFIGRENLEALATTISPDIVMTPAVKYEEEISRLGIRVISGVGYRNIKYVLVRKGHTARRKEVGDKLNSNHGKLIENALVTYLSWDVVYYNQDSFRDLAVRQADGSDAFPNAELALREATMTYTENVFEDLFHGDASLERNGEQAPYALYDGLLTVINAHITNGNIVPVTVTGTLSEPVDADDQLAWLYFKNFIAKWSPRLRGAQKVIVATSVEAAIWIATAYGNSKNNHKEAITLPNRNYKFEEYPNVELCGSDVVGVGTKLIAYTDQNPEFGIDSLNPECGVFVKVGTDDDLKTVVIQTQGAYGTRFSAPIASNLCVTDAAMSPFAMAGDFTSAPLSVLSNNATYGSVLVNGEAPVEGQTFDTGVAVTLKAVATDTGKFVKWSNGATDEEITVIATGMPESYVATFDAK